MPRPRLNTQALDVMIAVALAEDIGPRDVTTATLIDPRQRGRGTVVAREPGVLAGMPVARRLLNAFDKRLKLSRALDDGASLKPDKTIAVLTGPLAPMLTVERTLLNFVRQLSGIATLTRRYVEAVGSRGPEVLDTRKTLPGWRCLAKYAVAVGGGRNHRMGLFDQVLIKDNHLQASRLSPADAAALARKTLPRKLPVEVEVETVRDARAAAEAGADIVLLDNMSPARMKAAVRAVRAASAKTLVEASGRVTLKNVRAVARTGVDWISVGALTHSAAAVDIALEIEATKR